MKKIFIFLMLLIFFIFTVSCAQIENTAVDTSDSAETQPSSETEQQFFEENKVTSHEKTTETIAESGETTLSSTDGGTENCSETSETTVEITTSYEDRYNLGMEYVMTYSAWIVTDGVEYEPYTSMIWCQNPYMTADGILMFVSMENQLPEWLDEIVIPTIEIREDSDLHFEYHEMAELICSGKFRIYLQDENGVVTKVKEFENASLSDVHAYGNEYLAGKIAYITYPFRLEAGDYSYLEDAMWGNHAVNEVMCIFATNF